MHEELMLNTQVPEALRRYGAKGEAREMIKAHNDMIMRKALAFEGRPTCEIRTLESEERTAKNQQIQLLSSFEDAGYRATAKRFLEKVLPGVKQELAGYDAEVKEATAKYNEAVARLQEATAELKKSKKKRSDFCRDIGTIIVKPFLYANEGGGILPRCGKTPQRLYPQLGFSVPSYNFEPAEHIEYMLQEINRREGLVND